MSKAKLKLFRLEKKHAYWLASRAKALKVKEAFIIRALIEDAMGIGNKSVIDAIKWR